MWVSLLSWIPVGAICAASIRERAVYVMLPLMAVIAVVHFRANLFRCPKCRRFFAVKGFTSRRGPWSRQCVHCGIVIGTLQRTETGVFPEL